MFKKFFDVVNLNLKVKRFTEAMKTIKVTIELLEETLEHPIKSQKAMKQLVKDLKGICDKF